MCLMKRLIVNLFWPGLWIDLPWLCCSVDAAGSLRKQGVGINAIVQQNQEFSIQNEDFPALPGYKGGHHLCCQVC